jgi:hypothetical protein
MSYLFEEEDRLIQYDRQYYGEELNSREFIEFGCRNSIFTIPYPVVTGTVILNEDSWAIKWMGDKQIRRRGFTNPQAVYLFPIIPPDIPEIELMHQHEWDTHLIGTVEDLAASPYARYFDIPHEVSREKLIAVIKPNHMIHGLDSRPMHLIYYIAQIICRVIEGDWMDYPGGVLAGGEHPVFPKKYQLSID